MAKASIITGHYVKLEQTTAGLGDRIIAQIIDWLFFFAYEIAIFVLFAVITEYFPLSSNDVLEVFFVILLFLPLVFYFPLCELLNNGQSIGKKIMRIRVVMVDGSAPTLGAILLRWALYPIDVLLTAGLGSIFILFSEKNQRMGDLAAGTTVIKLQDNTIGTIDLNEFSYIMPNYKPTYHEATNLTISQIELLSRVLYNNRPERWQYIEELAKQVQQTLNIPPLINGNNEAFLWTVYNDAYHYNATITA